MTYKLLFVDDEKDILACFKRLFMEDGYEIFTATNGHEALEILKNGAVDLIVSDQRMPGMEGVEFLKQSKAYSPDSIRIVLTGYADINAAIDSINKGEVYRYITKPWNNDEIRSMVRDALELRRLRKENEALLELTQRQNLELKDLNTNLEEKVKAQTKEIYNMLDELKAVYGRLDKSFMDTVRVLSNIIMLREKTSPLRLRNAPKLAKAVAQRLNLPETEIKDIEIAALLYDIGKIGTPDNILNKPFANMTAPERAAYMKHPILGQAALQSIENMQEVGLIVRHHHERWDGEGYPDNLSGEDISISARIVSVVSDYYELLSGFLMPSKFTSYEAKRFIVESSGQRYEPRIVGLFVSLLGVQEKEAEESSEFKVSSSELKVGMVISRDIYTASGLLLLNEGRILTERHISNIINFERSDGRRYEIYVLPKARQSTIINV